MSSWWLAWAGYSYMNNSWALVTVGHYQAVGDVMQLAAQPAAQVQPAHQLARLAAVAGVLQLLQAALQITFSSPHYAFVLELQTKVKRRSTRRFIITRRPLRVESAY